MLIKLSNGTTYRVSWKHLDASEEAVSLLVSKKQYEEIQTRCDLLVKVLKGYYKSEKDLYNKVNRIHGVTECFLVEEGKERLESANGVAFCSVQDKFNKELGRKRSLLDALDFVFPLDEPVLSHDEWTARKHLRGEIWQAYRMSTKEPRW